MLSKNQLHKIGQPIRFKVRPLGPLLKSGLSLMKNILQRLAKSVLIPLGMTVAASATDASIQMKTFGSGMMILIILNEEIKIIKSLEEPCLLIKCVSKTIKGGFPGMLLGALRVSLLGNLLTCKEVKSKIPGREVIRAGGGTIRASQDF